MEAQTDLLRFHVKFMPSGPDHVVGSFLAAAVGDAFGWPYEDRSRRIEKLADHHVPDDFLAWKRRVGTRFLTYEEPIAPGAYSDDTQLILATARSLLHKNWWRHFTRVELPMWSLYQRGGGGATKRAVDLWLQRKAPWQAAKESARYFEAGGNGVSMRILPHVVVHAKTDDFGPLYGDIVRNGITTHGHPRALLGGLLHGYALWFAFRQRDTLDYGALIAAAIDNVSVWARSPQLPFALSQSGEWNAQAGYSDLWKKTVDEILQLLAVAQNGIERGSLTIGREILSDLGAFNRQINGAGTIAAVAAIFLASRYAASPLQGILAAATSHGSDTDTIASMSGSLLGAIHGDDWLGRLGKTVQDATYIRKLASRLTTVTDSVSHDLPDRLTAITRTTIRAFFSKLGNKAASDQVDLADGQSAAVVKSETLPSRNADVRMWTLLTDDGQTLFITQAKKGGAKKVSGSVPKTDQEQRGLGLVRFGIRLLVRDLTEAKRFYVEQLGLLIERESAAGFTVNGTISIHENSAEIQQPTLGVPGVSTTLCLKVENALLAYEHLRRRGTDVIGPVSTRKGVRFFHVRDPSGNVIEIFEATARA